MKSVKIQLALFAMFMFMGGMAATAQEKKAAVPNEQAWLQKFVGKWTAKVVMTDDKKQTMTFTAQMNYSSVADGTGVYGTESVDDPKLGKLRASYLMGYDPYGKKVHFYAVVNMGVCHDHDCTWKTPDHLYMEHNSMRDGKAFKEVIDLVFKDKNTIEFTETDYLGGNTIETDQGTFKKAK
ncbi:MAG: DUF1579 family protein [Bacteroidetes bacterium]|nr:DUF1579 family protein [Bacteroidota bacterium]